MRKCYCISVIIYTLLSATVYAEILNVGIERVSAPIFSKISITLKGDAWILDAGTSQFSSTNTGSSSIISLLEIEEKEQSTRFIVLRTEAATDTLVFSRNDLQTGQQYTYSIIIQWSDIDTDIFSDMGINAYTTGESTSTNESNNDDRVKSPYTPYTKNTQKNIQTNTQSASMPDNSVQGIEQEAVQEIALFSDAIITVGYVSFVESLQNIQPNIQQGTQLNIQQNTQSSTRREQGIILGDSSESANAQSNSVESDSRMSTQEQELVSEQAQEQATVQQDTARTQAEQSVIENEATSVQQDTQQTSSATDEIALFIDSREQSIQQDKADNQNNSQNNSQDSTMSTSTDASASMSLQDIQTQMKTLWNKGNKQEAEALVVSWVQNNRKHSNKKHSNEKYSEEAEAYYMLATMYENTATEIADIRKAIDFYTIIYTQYILSQYYELAQQHIEKLQNTYIFIR